MRATQNLYTYLNVVEKPVSSNASTDGGDDVGAGGVDTEEGHLPIPWSEKHRQLRDLIPWLIEHHFSGSLREMARSIGWERMTISRYLSGKTCRGQAMDPVKLQMTYTSLMEDLWRNNLPCAIPPARDSNLAASSSPSQSSTASPRLPATSPTTTDAAAHTSPFQAALFVRWLQSSRST